MKIADPFMKFRVELNVGCLEQISTHETHEQGLEDCDLYFVELQEYIDEFGDPGPRDIVEDYLPGGTKKVPGVNVREGKKGWWKRINRRVAGVTLCWSRGWECGPIRRSTWQNPECSQTCSASRSTFGLCPWDQSIIFCWCSSSLTLFGCLKNKTTQQIYFINIFGL